MWGEGASFLHLSLLWGVGTPATAAPQRCQEKPPQAEAGLAGACRDCRLPSAASMFSLPRRPELRLRAQPLLLKPTAASHKASCPRAGSQEVRAELRPGVGDLLAAGVQQFPTKPPVWVETSEMSPDHLHALQHLPFWYHSEDTHEPATPCWPPPFFLQPDRLRLEGWAVADKRQSLSPGAGGTPVPAPSSSRVEASAEDRACMRGRAQPPAGEGRAAPSGLSGPQHGGWARGGGAPGLPPQCALGRCP